MDRFLKWRYALFFYLFCLGAYYGALYLISPPEPTSDEVQIVYIRPGTPFIEVAKELEERGLVRNRYAFLILAYLMGEIDKIRAGEYELSPAEKAIHILDKLARGEVIQHIITIPEGYNVYQIARLLDKASLVEAQKFLTACREKAFLKALGIEATSCEGYLFPDTYYLTRGMQAQDIIRQMVERFWEVWEKNNFSTRAQELGLSVHEVLTLASIVEKETYLESERPIIAGVFFNRLKRGMPLQADPTVRYGLSKFRRRLSRRDLRHPNPYNTYLRPGLPPGPIANPGLSSIRAVLWPAETKYLYFVAKPNGGHHFSRTLREHNRAVRKYRRRHRPTSYHQRGTVRKDKKALKGDKTPQPGGLLPNHLENGSP
ncbi:endolytic transglycosylase MltG [Thermosulfuriphilus sp.]